MQAFGNQCKNKLRQFFLNENNRIGREILKAIKCTNQYSKVAVREQQKGPVFYWLKRELSELSLYTVRNTKAPVN